MLYTNHLLALSNLSYKTLTDSLTSLVLKSYVLKETGKGRRQNCIDWYDKTADFRDFIFIFIECKEKVHFYFQMKNEINLNIFNFILLMIF